MSILPSNRSTPTNWLLNRNGGFMMIEIPMVLAFVGILALIALPKYLDIYIRHDIADAQPLVDILKSPVANADAWPVAKVAKRL